MRLHILSLIGVLLAITGPSSTYALQSREDLPTSERVARSSDRPIRNLAVAPEELGPNWLIVPESVEEIDAEHLGHAAASPSDPLALFQARYRNNIDFEPAREAAFLVAEFRDHEQADRALHEYLNYFMIGNLVPDARWPWHGEKAELGDQGYRFGYCLRGMCTAGYIFTMETYLGGVLLRGVEAHEQALLADATTVTSWQETLLTSRNEIARSVP